MSKKPPYAERTAQDIIAALKDGTAPWVKPWQPGQIVLPFNATTGATYQGINALKLSMPGYTDPRWMTYRQAQSTGWQVIKGAHGVTTRYWKLPERETATSGQSVTREPKRPQVFYSTAFHASQINGIPPWQAQTRTQAWPEEARAEALLHHSGALLLHDQRDRAFYRPSTDEIHLPPRAQFETPAAYYATALHELGHWTGHPTRLDRDLQHPHGSEGYAREELRAEIGSYLIAGELGLGHEPGPHMSYIDHWVTILEKDHTEIFRACRDAEKIKTFVMAPEAEQSRAHIAPADTPPSVQETSMALPEQVAPEKPAPAERVYLAVPFEEKEAAKKHGAHWNRKNKKWFVDLDPGAGLGALERWRPVPDTRVETPPAAFGAACTAMGLKLDGAPVMDGELHREHVLGDRSNQRSGAYVGHLDDHPAGYVQNFKTGEKQNWHYEHAPGLSAAELTQQRADITSKHEAQAEKHLADHQRTASEATQKVAELQPVEQPTPYMRSKGLAVGAGALTDSAGTKTYLPLRDIEGTVWSLQTIDAEGNKRFLKGGKKQGCYFVAGATHPAQDVCWIAEGFATAATVSRAIHEPVIVAFDAGNLKAVAETMHHKHPEKTICILADNDKVGLDKAQAAASAVGGITLAPQFAPSETGKDFSDWNDLAHHSQLGGDAVRTQVTHGIHELELTPNTAQEPAGGALKATLRNAYLHTDKAAAIEAHPEIEPLYQFEVAATQFVAANREQFSYETRETFVRTVCEKALDVLARGEILPDKPNLCPLPAPSQTERAPEPAPGL